MSKEAPKPIMSVVLPPLDLSIAGLSGAENIPTERPENVVSGGTGGKIPTQLSIERAHIAPDISSTHNTPSPTRRTEKLPPYPPETGLPPSAPAAEAGRIAGELAKLHRAGAIKNEQDASFYAGLIHLFGATVSPAQEPTPPPISLPSNWSRHRLTDCQARSSAITTSGISRPPSARNSSTATTGLRPSPTEAQPGKRNERKTMSTFRAPDSVTVRAYVHDLLFVAVHRLRPPLPRRC
jgi:hypothetical protein